MGWIKPTKEFGSAWSSQVVLVVKNLPANAGDMRDVGLIPGSGRSPGGGNGNALQYSCLENPTDRGAWQATVHGVRKTDTDTTEDWTWLKQLSIYRNYGNYCLEGKGWPGSRLLFDLYRWRPAYQCKLFLENSLAPLKRRRKKKLGPFHVWQIYHLTWVSKPSWTHPWEKQKTDAEFGFSRECLVLMYFLRVQ